VDDAQRAAALRVDRGHEHLHPGMNFTNRYWTYGAR
jgi:hypothetical protein